MVHLEIAGVSLALRGPWERLHGLVDQFRRYLVESPAERPFTVVLSEGLGGPAPDAPLKLVRTGGWLTADLDERVIVLGGTRPDLTVGEQILPVERLLMHAFACVLAYRGGLILHAAAVDGPQGAVAFLGPSEAGKTTAASNCPTRMLHQDRVAIGHGARGPWVAPVPFLYDEPRTGSVAPMPLARLVVVKKAGRMETNEVSMLPRRLRVATLCSSILMPPDPTLASRALETAERVSSEVAFQVLRARRDGGFWNLLTGEETSVASPQEAD